MYGKLFGGDACLFFRNADTDCPDVETSDLHLIVLFVATLMLVMTVMPVRSRRTACVVVLLPAFYHETYQQIKGS